MDGSEDLKHYARQRREMKLRDMADGLAWGDRIIPSEKLYRRNMKYRPRFAFEWEELED